MGFQLQLPLKDMESGERCHPLYADTEGIDS
jgi:hypothetical protein